MSKKNAKKAMRECAFCGKPFSPKAANAAYCGEKCYKAAKAERRAVKRREVHGKCKKPTVAKAKKPVADVKATLSVKKVESPMMMFSLAFRLMADALRIVGERAAHDVGGRKCGKSKK